MWGIVITDLGRREERDKRFQQLTFGKNWSTIGFIVLSFDLEESVSLQSFIGEMSLMNFALLSHNTVKYTNESFKPGSIS